MSVETVRERAAHLGPERRRPQVLDAALAIAVSDGIAAVTIGAVAQRLKVTRPVVYSCFPDRVELLRALLERELALLVQGRSMRCRTVARTPTRPSSSRASRRCLRRSPAGPIPGGS